MSKPALHLLLVIGLSLIAIPDYCQDIHTNYTSYTNIQGAIVRGDSSIKELALVFTGDAYADGGIHIAKVLADRSIKGSFFFTGKFYSNPDFKSIIDTLRNKGHYLGAHSDQHLLYCTWENRDSLLVSKEQFTVDLLENYSKMLAFGISREDAVLFLPPYEWYNDSIARWTRALGLQLINNTHGTLSHADYTVPGTLGYRSSEEIFQSILEYEASASDGLKGFILLSHIGTVPERTDKFYLYLEKLLEELKSRGYKFKRIDELLTRHNH
jgi:peptidoglycan/xylan/chitin deacetylase (PgdA/CDA1 family)